MIRRTSKQLSGVQYPDNGQAKKEMISATRNALVDRADDVGQGHTGHQADADSTDQDGDHRVDLELDDKDEQ